MKISKNSLLIVGFLFVFRGMLDLSYIYKIFETYSYQGFYINIQPSRYLGSWCAFFAILPFLLRNRDTLAGKISFSLVACAFVPMSSYFGLAGTSATWLVLSLIFWAIVSLVSSIRLPEPRFRRPKSLFPVLLLIGSFALGTWVIVVMYFGISFHLSFDDVYEIRAENTLSSIPLGGYIVPWAGKVALPVLALLGLQRRGTAGWVMLASAVLMDLMIFATTGHKAFIFAMAMMLVLYYVGGKRRQTLIMSAGLAAGVLACYLLDTLLGESVLSGLITRRVFFVPAFLSDVYHQFFARNPMYLSHSILSPWIENPLHMAPSKAVGLQFFGSETLNANNGVVGDGFMNFGVIGVLLWAVLTGLVIAFFDAISRKVNPKLAFSIGVTTLFTFINGGLLVTLMTHGVIFAVVMVMLCPVRIRPDSVMRSELQQRPLLP